MKLAAILAVAAGGTTALAMFVARRVARGDARFVALRRWTWVVASSLLLVAAVYVAHMAGLFSIPLVAVAFVAVAVPGRLLLGSAWGRRRRTMAAAPAATARRDGPIGFLARHEIVTATALVLAVAVIGAVAGMLVSWH